MDDDVQKNTWKPTNSDEEEDDLFIRHLEEKKKKTAPKNGDDDNNNNNKDHKEEEKEEKKKTKENDDVIIYEDDDKVNGDDKDTKEKEIQEENKKDILYNILESIGTIQCSYEEVFEFMRLKWPELMSEINSDGYKDQITKLSKLHAFIYILNIRSTDKRGSTILDMIKKITSDKYTKGQLSEIYTKAGSEESIDHKIFTTIYNIFESIYGSKDDSINNNGNKKKKKKKSKNRRKIQFKEDDFTLILNEALNTLTDIEWPMKQICMDIKNTNFFCKNVLITMKSNLKYDYTCAYSGEKILPGEEVYLVSFVLNDENRDKKWSKKGFPNREWESDDIRLSTRWYLVKKHIICLSSVFYDKKYNSDYFTDNDDNKNKDNKKNKKKQHNDDTTNKKKRTRSIKSITNDINDSDHNKKRKKENKEEEVIDVANMWSIDVQSHYESTSITICKTGIPNDRILLISTLWKTLDNMRNMISKYNLYNMMPSFTQLKGLGKKFDSVNSVSDVISIISSIDNDFSHFVIDLIDILFINNDKLELYKEIYKSDNPECRTLKNNKDKKKNDNTKCLVGAPEIMMSDDDDDDDEGKKEKNNDDDALKMLLFPGEEDNEDSDNNNDGDKDMNIDEYIFDYSGLFVDRPSENSTINSSSKILKLLLDVSVFRKRQFKKQGKERPNVFSPVEKGIKKLSDIDNFNGKYVVFVIYLFNYLFPVSQTENNLEFHRTIEELNRMNLFVDQTAAAK